MNVIEGVQKAEAFLEEVAVDAQVVIPFIYSTITAVENTGKALGLSGTDKLTSVLNAVDALLTGLPNGFARVQDFLKLAEDLINAVVKMWNDASVFFHGVAEEA